MNRAVPAALVLLGAGAVLVAASLVWPFLVDPRTEWSQEQAHDRAEAGMTVHELVHEMGHTRDEAQRQEIARQLAAAQERSQAVDEQLDQARRGYDRPIAWLRWTGTACLALGAVAYIVLRARRA